MMCYALGNYIIELHYEKGAFMGWRWYQWLLLRLNGRWGCGCGDETSPQWSSFFSSSLPLLSPYLPIHLLLYRLHLMTLRLQTPSSSLGHQCLIGKVVHHAVDENRTPKCILLVSSELKGATEPHVQDIVTCFTLVQVLVCFLSYFNPGASMFLYLSSVVTIGD